MIGDQRSWIENLQMIIGEQGSMTRIREYGWGFEYGMDIGLKQDIEIDVIEKEDHDLGLKLGNGG